MKLETTAMHFLLKHQELHKRSYNFLILMEAIMTASKKIQEIFQKGALKGHLETTGATNVQNELVTKMDDMANAIMIHYLRNSGQAIQAVSEEEHHIIDMEDIERGRYFVYFDPLDGFSNVDLGLPVGCMFGIAKKNLDEKEDFHLRKGIELIAAGIFVIPSGIFILSLQDSGTYRFYLDETQTFVRPEKIILPTAKKKWELSFNTAYRKTFNPKIKNWIEGSESKYGFRYSGTLAVDIHRLLANGGVFMYPERPEKTPPVGGKLRLLYEANVAAFIVHEAGGESIDEHGNDILEIEPREIHQRTALYTGSIELIEEIKDALRG